MLLFTLILLTPALALPSLSSLHAALSHFAIIPSSDSVLLPSAGEPSDSIAQHPANAIDTPHTYPQANRRRHRLRRRGTGTNGTECTLSERHNKGGNGGGGGGQGNNNGGGQQGPIIQVSDTACGSTAATAQTSTATGPNGAEAWLNCGLTSAQGWNPPFVRISDLVTTNLSTALAEVGTPFAPCAPYLGSFEKYGSQLDIPPIILASIALQESTCNPNAIGAGGTAGLMQISTDKCTGAPSGNCLDPDFNIGAGAKYFADTISQQGGNVLQALGFYNGWYVGMTAAAVEKVGQGPCCGCMQNLDYLQQSLNGWFVGKDAYALGLGTFQNLNVCQK